MPKRSFRQVVVPGNSIMKRKQAILVTAEAFLVSAGQRGFVVPIEDTLAVEQIHVLSKSAKVPLLSAILWFNCRQPDVDDLTIRTGFAIRLVHEIDITRRDLALRRYFLPFHENSMLCPAFCPPLQKCLVQRV